MNQLIGKSMTDVAADLSGTDYIYTFVPTRSLRSQIQTTVSNMMVIAEAPNADTESSGTFRMLD